MTSEGRTLTYHPAGARRSRRFNVRMLQGLRVFSKLVVWQA
jgi:hypothetical protein